MSVQGIFNAVWAWQGCGKVPLECVGLKIALLCCLAALVVTPASAALPELPSNSPGVQTEPLDFLQPYVGDATLAFLEDETGRVPGPDVVNLILGIVSEYLGSDECEGTICLCTMVKDLLNMTGIELPGERCEICLGFLNIDDTAPLEFRVAESRYTYQGLRVLTTPGRLGGADSSTEYAIMKIANYAQLGGVADCSIWETESDS
jgi:hypothetical protein